MAKDDLTKRLLPPDDEVLDILAEYILEYDPIAAVQVLQLAREFGYLPPVSEQPKVH